MKLRIGIIALVFTVLNATPASADTLFLQGGDRIDGTLSDISNGTLSFRTKLAGKLYLPVDGVLGINTTNLVVLTLADDKTLPGRMVYENDATYLYASDNVVHGPIALSDVKTISSLPATLPPENEPSPTPKDSLLSVSLDAGYRWRTGTEDYSGPRIELRLNTPTKSGKFESRVNLEYAGEGGEDGAINRFFDAQARATVDRGSTWSPELTLQIESDRNKALKLRGEVLAGLGRDVLLDDKQRLIGAAGIGVAFERYDIRQLRRDMGGLLPPPMGSDTSTEREVNLDLQLRYERRIFGKGVLREGLTLRPSLSNIGDLRSRLESSVLVPIPLGLKLKVDLLLDYEDEPQYAEVDEWSTAFGASLHLDF